MGNEQLQETFCNSATSSIQCRAHYSESDFMTNLGAVIHDTPSHSCFTVTPLKMVSVSIHIIRGQVKSVSSYVKKIFSLINAAVLVFTWLQHVCLSHP